MKIHVQKCFAIRKIFPFLFITQTKYHNQYRMNFVYRSDLSCTLNSLSFLDKYDFMCVSHRGVQGIRIDKVRK